MLRFVKSVILGFMPEDAKQTGACVAIPNLDFEEVPTILPGPPSRFVARFGEGFKKEGIVCAIGGGVVTIACMVKPGVVGEIVVRPMREIRLSMY